MKIGKDNDSVERLSRMTDVERRIRVAELCGWSFNKVKKYICGESYEIINPDGKAKDTHIYTYRTIHSASGVEDSYIPFMSLDDICLYGDIPDYLNDLNAMHKAEKMMKTDDQLEIYQGYLDNFVGVKWPRWRANAAQRASAFILTMEHKDE